MEDKEKPKSEEMEVDKDSQAESTSSSMSEVVESENDVKPELNGDNVEETREVGENADELSLKSESSSSDGSKTDEKNKAEVVVKTEIEDTEESGDDGAFKGFKRRASDQGEGSKAKEFKKDSKGKSLMKSEKEDFVLESSTSDMTLPIKQTMGKGKRARIPNKRYSDININLSPAKIKAAVENGKVPSTDKAKVPAFEKAKPPAVEKIEAEGTIYDDAVKLRKSTNSPVPKKPKSVDLSDPVYLKPFTLGWRRELVWRGTNEPLGKINGDVYYFTPQDKKLRSMREISEVIDNKTLTLDNFTFAKQAIGVENETVRNANPVGKSPGIAKIKKSVLSPKLSPKLTAPKVPTVKIAKTAKSPVVKLTALKSPNAKAGAKSPTTKSPAVATKSPTTVTKSPATANKSPAKEKSPAPAVKPTSPVKASKSVEEEDKSPPAATPPSPPAKAAQKSTPKAATESPKPKGKASGNFKVKLPHKIERKLAPAKTPTKEDASEENNMPARKNPPRKTTTTPKWDHNSTNSPTTSPNVSNSERKACQPCSISCEGMLGIIPTLQCKLCLCLYHYECMGLEAGETLPEYVCKNCQAELNDMPNLIPPPLTPISTLKNQTATTILPKLQRIPKPGENENVTLPTATLQTVSKIIKMSDASAGTSNETRSLLGSVTSWLPQNSKIQVDNAHQRPEGIPEVPRPQYVEYLAGRKFLIIPKHNIVSVSPAVNSGPVGTATSASEEVATSEGGPDVCNIKTEPESPGKVREEAMEVDEVAETTNGTETATNELPTRRSLSRRKIQKVNHIPGGDKIEGAKFMENYLQNLSYGYNTLLYVFQYLKVQDLLRAGCVCTMWRDVASHPLLWRTVRMKNSQVHSFEGLTNTLQKHGTVHLDLRKMLLTNGDEIWPEFTGNIHKVDTLRKIELCRCPASVVESLMDSNPKLEVVNAVAIRCEYINLERLSQLKNLRELRLKSTTGLSVTSDIDSLKELYHLKHLSLTSIRDLNKMNLEVLAGLNNLESLDLGECSDFPHNFGQDILSKLTRLEKLRLEKGQGNCHTFEILDAVKNMPQLEQLELVNFDIKAGFDKALGACKNIKKLLIIPTYISQSATTNHMVLGGVLRLQKTLSHFVWGVTLELLRVTELFVDQCEEPEKKDKKDKKAVGNGDSIPVLKPVPLIVEGKSAAAPAHDTPQVEILPLPNLQKLLLQSLPTTRVKILKIPFHATWRQSITDSVN